MESLKKIYLLFIFALLSACSGYQPKTLATQSSLPEQIPRIQIDQQHQVAGLVPHSIDPATGLDMDEVAMVVVLNNPDLKLARDDANISRAQAFAAGLLPDPQLTVSTDLSNSGGPGTGKAYSVGLSYDIQALLTYHTNNAAAQADIKKTDLNLLWQEWQVVAQARLMYIKLTSAKKLQLVLESNRSMFAERVNKLQVAFDKNLIANDAVLPDLSALQDVQRQFNDVERQINQNQHDLNALLGLSPNAEVLLRDSAPLAELDEATIVEKVNQLPQRRPDLQALQFGFDAQNQRYRAALLAQFPSFNVGFTKARDNAGIYSNGLGVTLSLPLLNRNRGNIAIEQATRDKLADDYQQRLDSANSDAHRLLVERRINARQLDDIQASLAKFNTMANNADSAAQNNIVDTLIVTNAHITLLAKQIEVINLQQAMLEQQVALLTLIGGDLPEQNQLHNLENK